MPGLVLLGGDAKDGPPVMDCEVYSETVIPRSPCVKRKLSDPSRFRDA